MRHRLEELRDTVHLARAMQRELEMLSMLKDAKGATDVAVADSKSTEASASGFSKLLKDRRIDLLTQESLSVEAVNSLISKLSFQVRPFRVIVDENSPWEEKSVASRLINKIQKSKRNKLWRKRKRKRIAEMLAKEHERFDQADQEADEWRAREIAKDIAQRKVERMKEIAKLKAKQERQRLEFELELVLVVEKLQELRSIRIQKLKKQGHFLPDEDDAFLERVRAAVEQEEQQAMAAADMDAAKDAIATAEESRKIILEQRLDLYHPSTNHGQSVIKEDQMTPSENKSDFSTVTGMESQNQGSESWGHAEAYNSLANLPMEFYHYYHGSNTDMGTLIEVRRQWDSYIRPGGSRIPGHWVRPPPPANDIWASYLVAPK